MRQGLLAAQGRVAVFSDADLSTPIEELPKLLQDPILAGDYDVVFGSRALDRSLIGVHQPWLREQSGRFSNFVTRAATGLPLPGYAVRLPRLFGWPCAALAEAAALDRWFRRGAAAAGPPRRPAPTRAARALERCHRQPVGLLSGLNGFWELRQLRRRAAQGHYEAACRQPGGRRAASCQWLLPLAPGQARRGRAYLSGLKIAEP
ncbi:MAG: hypothetical protein WKG07_05775 [Hymenobacter sp.]